MTKFLQSCLTCSLLLASAGCNADQTSASAGSSHTTKQMSQANSPATKQKASPFDKPGYVTFIDDGRLWIFREGSEELTQFKAKGEPAKVVIRPGAGPNRMTVKAVDAETIDGYMFDKPGFVTFVDDGRLWIFREGSEELTQFKAKGEPAKVVIRPGAGPNRMTVKAVDAETIDGYMAQ